MKPNSVYRRRKGEKGMAFIELLVGVAIAGILIPLISQVSFQLMSVNERNTHQNLALVQTQKVIYWIKRDAQMAQVVQTSPGSGFPLTLSWVEWDNTRYEVIYSLDGDKLYRDYSLNGGAPSRMTVAELIDSDASKTNSQFAVGVLTFKVTAFAGGYKPISETRTAQVMPRPAP